MNANQSDLKDHKKQKRKGKPLPKLMKRKKRLSAHIQKIRYCKEEVTIKTEEIKNFK